MAMNETIRETLALVKGLRKDTTTSGVSTGSGLNFYYLEQAAKNIYPVFYPILKTTPRVNPMFNGQKVGGTAVNWKAIVGINNGGYPAISEGNRNAAMKYTTRNYSAPFKFLGTDTNVSFQAQQSGMGFDDNIANAQLGMLNSLLNDEERMMLFGNSGPANVGGNGYALGTTNTPTVAQSTVSGTLAASTTNYVFCVALTPWGQVMATSTGVQLPFTRNNVDGSQDVINGGTGIISAASSAVTTDSSHKSITATVAYTVGATGYAWYLSQTAATTSSAYFVGVTSVPTITISSFSNTTQAANATGAGGVGLTTDNSYNTLDFDGIMTWHFGTYGSSQPAYLADQGGSGFTSNGDGTILEWENCADYLWNNYKASIDAIYLGGTLIQAASKAIMTSSTGPGAQRVIIDRGASGEVTGGQIITQYNWKYSGTAQRKTVPVMAHPWLPAGTVLFDITNNPYPAAGDAIPSVRRIVSLEDHFSIKWPYRNLKHELGVYCFETLEHYLPFAGGVITGVANKVN